MSKFKESINLTPEQIREIVRVTIDEIIDRKLMEIKEVKYSVILQAVEKRLTKFFTTTNKDKSLSYALRSLSDDEYVDIIYLQYRDHKTLEWIAEYLNREVCTIKRNKKRLIIKMYEMLNEE